jgi:hypothetical protein
VNSTHVSMIVSSYHQSQAALPGFIGTRWVGLKFLMRKPEIMQQNANL